MPYQNIDTQPINPLEKLTKFFSSSVWAKSLFWLFGAILIAGLLSQAFISFTQTSDTKEVTSTNNNEALATKSFSLERSISNRSVEASTIPNQSLSLLEWSPALVKLGFSFFVGFSIGFVLKTFFKISLFFSGAIFLLLFGLSYLNIVEVRWDMIESYYQSMLANFNEQFTVFKAFITGSLPSAGSFSVGLLTATRVR